MNQVLDEVAIYQRLKRQDSKTLASFDYFSGELLIAMRIYRGKTQSDLATILGVSQAQVSRDEKNCYHGVSVSKYRQIVHKLGFHLTSKIKVLDFDGDLKRA